MHITVLTKGQTPSIARCNTCCSKYHCPFCTPEVYRPNEFYHVQNHVLNHTRIAVVHEDFAIVKCNLKCRDQAHFHCCYCTATVIRKVQIIRHLTACRRESARLPLHAACTPSTPVTDLPSAPDPIVITKLECNIESVSTADPASITNPESDIERASVADPTSITNPATLQICSITETPSAARRIRVQTKVQCPHCGLFLNKKNLNIHINRRHSLKITEITDTHHLSSQCIDPLNGIFAVEKSFDKPCSPIHVQKKMSGASSVVVCEMDECNTNMEFASQSEFCQFECVHLKSLQFSPWSVTLEENVLTDMVQAEIFGEQTETTCINRKKAASAAGVPFTAEVTVGNQSTNKYISVFEPKLSCYSRLGRVIVAYDSSRNTWHCPCVKGRSCIHINISKWHLFQTDRQLFES